MVLTSSSLSLPIPSVSWCIHLAPVLYSSFTSRIQVATMVVQFDVDNVDNKGKDFQQFRFLFALSILHRKQMNIFAHFVFSFKSFQALGGPTQQIFDIIFDIRSNKNNFVSNLI